jgi:hypothetical protein
MRFTKSLTDIFLLIVLFSAASFAQDSGKMKNDMSKKEMMDKEKMHGDMMQNDMKSNICTNSAGLAINGFDAVSYFSDSKPALGKKDFTYSWMNAKWQFASEEHLKMFKENPEKYAPQFGGFCAYAVSKNKTAPGNPTAWQIRDGKLYLNVNGNVQKLFNEDVDGNIKKAEKNWKSMNMSNEEMINDKMEKKK